MSVILAVRCHPGNASERWIDYCRHRGIAYRVVDLTTPDVIAQLRGGEAMLWDWSAGTVHDRWLSEYIIRSAEHLGLRVFPNSDTFRTDGDKIGQKYLLEAVDAPLVPIHVFYSQEKAMAWIERAEFPKVFKLRYGSGSENVCLARTRQEAERLCSRAFGKGFPPKGAFGLFRGRLPLRRADWWKIRQLPGRIRAIRSANRRIPRQRGYVFFQDYVPDSRHDTVVVVIGNRAFAHLCGVASGDFRAFAGRKTVYDPTRIDLECVKLAFSIARSLRTQAIVFNFIHDQRGVPWVLEMGITLGTRVVSESPGYWTPDLEWHEGPSHGADCVIEDLLGSLDHIPLEDATEITS